MSLCLYVRYCRRQYHMFRLILPSSPQINQGMTAWTWNCGKTSSGFSTSITLLTARTWNCGESSYYFSTEVTHMVWTRRGINFYRQIFKDKIHWKMSIVYFIYADDFDSLGTSECRFKTSFNFPGLH